MTRAIFSLALLAVIAGASVLLAAATLPFLFSRNFTIYGGNIASTLAGEFAFSIALVTALVFLGVVARGLETGRYRGWAAALLLVTGVLLLAGVDDGLYVVIPAVFAAIAGGVVSAWLFLTRVTARDPAGNVGRASLAFRVVQR